MAWEVLSLNHGFESDHCVTHYLPSSVCETRVGNPFTWVICLGSVPVDSIGPWREPPVQGASNCVNKLCAVKRYREWKCTLLVKGAILQRLQAV